MPLLLPFFCKFYCVWIVLELTIKAIIKTKSGLSHGVVFTSKYNLSIKAVDLISAIVIHFFFCLCFWSRSSTADCHRKLRELWVSEWVSEWVREWVMSYLATQGFNMQHCKNSISWLVADTPSNVVGGTCVICTVLHWGDFKKKWLKSVTKKLSIKVVNKLVVATLFKHMTFTYWNYIKETISR